MPASPDLQGSVALVAGGTRGAGRGIAVELGAAGATVIVTGRTTEAQQSSMGRPETIEQTARLVSEVGGAGHHRRVDHAVGPQVAALAQWVESEFGRLDVLVNDIWGGDHLTEWGGPFWSHSLDNGIALFRQAIETHVITSWHLAPLLAATGGGLVVEVTDGVSSRYRGSLFYDLAKSSTIRLAVAQAEEMRAQNVAAVSVSPGFLRSEAMLEHFGVSEASWRDAIVEDPHFAQSETPRYIGRGVAALAADPDKMALSGSATSSWDLVDRYEFRDLDGSRPHWGDYARAELHIEP